MNATKTRGRLLRPSKRSCPGHAHDYPNPLRERRPVVVFCARCQTAKTIG